MYGFLHVVWNTIQAAWRRYETRPCELLCGHGAQIWLVYDPILLIGGVVVVVVVVVERYTPILRL